MNGGRTVRQIGVMAGADLVEMLTQPIAHEIRQHHATVLLPLPRRTVISRRSKSRSFTRNSKHSCRRNPAP